MQLLSQYSTCLMTIYLLKIDIGQCIVFFMHCCKLCYLPAHTPGVKSSRDVVFSSFMYDVGVSVCVHHFLLVCVFL